MGLFAVGLAPTGTKDPFAQRRAALGICQNLIEWKLNFDLGWGLEKSGSWVIRRGERRKPGRPVLDFIQGRLKGMLLDMSFGYDVVEAVLTEQGQDPYGALLGVKALSAWVAREDWNEILPAFSRCVRIVRELDEEFSVQESLLTEESGKLLYNAVVKAEAAMGGAKDVDGFMTAFIPMVPVINRFFDEVLVMAEDKTIRQNRLALCQRIAALSTGIADLSLLEGF